MESTGVPDKVQISQVTANLLIKEGKARWVRERDDVIEVKGKGFAKTYWMNPNFKRTDSSSSKSTSEYISEGEQQQRNHTFGNESIGNSEIVKRDRLIDWMVDLLIEHIRKIVRFFIDIQLTKRKLSNKYSSIDTLHEIFLFHPF
jgi:hypothetical protein